MDNEGAQSHDATRVADDSLAADVRVQSTATPKAKHIRSLSEFLTYAYSRQGKVFSIPPTVRDALSRDATDRNQLEAQIIILAGTDPLLTVPVRILCAIDKAHCPRKLRDISVGLVANALEHHPLFLLAGLSAASLRVDSGREPESALAAIGMAVDLIDNQHLSGPSLRCEDLGVLKTNALVVTALLFAMERSWTAFEFAVFLNEHIWRSELAGKKVQSTRALLAESSSPATLGLVAQAWQSEIRDLARRLAAAQAETHAAESARDLAHRRVDSAEADAETLRRLLQSRDNAIAGLHGDLEREREARRVQRSHAIDDYENLRTGVIRRLDQQLPLLEDGLHALRNGSREVTDEYLERVIASLERERSGLRDKTLSPPEEPT